MDLQNPRTPGGGELRMKIKQLLLKVSRKFKSRSGQSLVEYALILALIAVVAILVLQGIGKSVNSKLSNVNSALQ